MGHTRARTGSRQTARPLSLPSVGSPEPTLLVADTATAFRLLPDLAVRGSSPYAIVGLVEPTETSSNTSPVNETAVLGGLSDLPTLVAGHDVRNLLIAVPADSDAICRRCLALCEGLPVRLRMLPPSLMHAHAAQMADPLRDLDPDDLLTRAPVEFGSDVWRHFRGRRVMVTGAAGTIGSEVCRQLLSLGVGTLVAVDINENGLYLFQQQAAPTVGERLVVRVADLRDANSVAAVVERYRPETIVHCAAHKHVPLMELAPVEAIKNNVIATRHLLQAAERFGCDRFLFVSSDKAVFPTSVMGATKRIGELMTRAVAERSALRTCVVRFGNVIGSDGSVVPIFRQQIAAGGPVTITDPDVRRFFMTTREAVGLMLEAGGGEYGELCVLDMGEPVRILDLARRMIALAGYLPEVDIPIVFTGLRPGEKLHEDLTMDDEIVAAGVGGRIQVVSGPPPPGDLWSTVDQLERAAAQGQTAHALELLKRIEPRYEISGRIAAVAS